MHFDANEEAALDDTPPIRFHSIDPPMEFEYIVVVRMSSTDVTAMKELHIGNHALTRTCEEIMWHEYDQMLIRFASYASYHARLVSLMARGKIIWFAARRG